MYCETCANSNPAAAFFEIRDIANHLTHKFESLQKYKEEKLHNLVHTKRQENTKLIRECAIIGNHIKKMYDKAKSELEEMEKAENVNMTMDQLRKLKSIVSPMQNGELSKLKELRESLGLEDKQIEEPFPHFDAPPALIVEEVKEN
jgi:hypothetical protein